MPDGRPIKVAAQIGAAWLVSCTRYSETGKVVRAWGPAQTAASTTCPAEAAPVPITDTAYDELDRPVRVTQYFRHRRAATASPDRLQRRRQRRSVNKAVGSAVAQAYARYTYTPNGTLSYVADAKGNLTASFYDG